MRYYLPKEQGFSTTGVGLTAIGAIAAGVGAMWLFDPQRPQPAPVAGRPAAQEPSQAQPAASAAAQQPAPEARPRPDHKQRPTRDSLQGERAPGNAGGRRRVVIDSQASRRAGGSGGPPRLYVAEFKTASQSKSVRLRGVRGK